MQVSKECIEGCLNNSRASQKELYDELLPYLNAICSRYLNNSSLRHDVLQESFLTIFNKISQFNPEKGALHSWSSRIVINNCLKQNSKGKKFFELQIGKYEKGIEPDIESTMSEADMVRFLKTMPMKYYEVFMLSVVDDFSHDEIAEMLGIKVELSRKRLGRAREWLQSKSKSVSELIGDKKKYVIS